MPNPATRPLSSAVVRELLGRLDIRPKKAWGQNFLCNASLANELLEGAAILPDVGVVEIGPGLGILTELLAQRLSPMPGQKSIPWIHAVELDLKLAAYLQDKFKDVKNLSIIQGDILSLDLAAVVPGIEDFQVVSNLPYSISTEVFFYFLRYWQRLPRLALMVQKEVAERLIAKAGDDAYGRLSILPQVYFEILALKNISGEHFFPSVAVHSTFLLLKRRAQPLIPELSDPQFSRTFNQLLAAIFSSRRKNLRNSLKRLGFLSEPALTDIFRAVNLPVEKRGETLSLSELTCLTQAILKTSGPELPA